MDFAAAWWALVVATWIAAGLAYRWERETARRRDRRPEGPPRATDVVDCSDPRLS